METYFFSMTHTRNIVTSHLEEVNCTLSCKVQKLYSVLQGWKKKTKMNRAPVVDEHDISHLVGKPFKQDRKRKAVEVARDLHYNVICLFLDAICLLSVCLMPFTLDAFNDTLSSLQYNMNQTAIANGAGVAQSHISNLLNDNHRCAPTYKTSDFPFKLITIQLNEI